MKTKVVLAENIDRYCGQYVAKKSFKDNKVIVSGKDPVKVLEQAKRRGADDPVIFYVPEKHVVHIY